MDTQQELQQPGKTRNVLIIECQSMLNWYQIFEGATLSDGSIIRVEQAVWDDISVVSYPDGVMVTCNRAARPHPGTSQEQQRSFIVDFILLRSVTRSIKGQDSRNKLFTFIHGNVPSVNSLFSAYVCLERVTVFSALKEIQKKLSKEQFPLIEQNFHPDFRSMIITPEYPIVAKVGSVHAGYGKIKCDNSRQLADFKSLCAVHGDYATIESFIEWDYDMRIQKIGPHYRAFRRVSSNWKGNVGNESMVEDMEMTDRHKLMVDECAKLFGGLDILGLDLVHGKDDGKEVILELNDTAIGLVHKHEKEDMQFMRDIVISRMNSLFSKTVHQYSGEEDIKSLKDEIEILNAQIQREQEKSRKLEQLQKQYLEKESSSSNCAQQ